MGEATICEITLKRKMVISFLLSNPNLSHNNINIFLDYIDALTNEQDFLIKQQEMYLYFLNNNEGD